MDISKSHYVEPKCSAVEFEVDGTILSASSLNQEKFSLDTYNDLTDVKW